MALELRQQLKLTQQLIMTPQLQMAIKLLQLSRLELMDTIHRELEENPALEEVADSSGEEPLSESFEVAEPSLSEMPAAPEVAPQSKAREEFDWSGFLDDFSTPSRVPVETEDREAPKYEAFITRKESLNDHLLWQFLMTKPCRQDEDIASLIIGNLNKDGYLQVSVEEIAAAGSTEPDKVTPVLTLLQTFDPIGVCARDLRECLLIQARYLGFDRSIITDIIAEHLPNLEKKNYKAICKALKIGMEEVVSAVAIIKAMEPRPGRQ
jgi:RNA polymerase sigma-54 factor